MSPPLFTACNSLPPGEANFSRGGPSKNWLFIAAGNPSPLPTLLRGREGQFAAGPPQGKLAPSGGSDPRSGGAWGS